MPQRPAAAPFVPRPPGRCSVGCSRHVRLAFDAQGRTRNVNRRTLGLLRALFGPRFLHFECDVAGDELGRGQCAVDIAGVFRFRQTTLPAVHGGFGLAMLVKIRTQEIQKRDMGPARFTALVFGLERWPGVSLLGQRHVDIAFAALSQIGAEHRGQIAKTCIALPDGPRVVLRGFVLDAIEDCVAFGHVVCLIGQDRQMHVKHRISIARDGR